MSVVIGPRLLSSSINPMSFGQPLVYYQSFDRSFFSNPTAALPWIIPTNGMSRYNDGLFDTRGGGNTSGFQLTNTDEPTLPYPIIRATGANANQRRVYGTTTLHAPLISSGFAFSLFYVARPQSPTSGTRVLWSTGAITLTNAPQIDLITTISSSEAGLLMRMSTDGGSGNGINIWGPDALIEPRSPVATFNNKPFRVFSVRCFDGNLVDPSRWDYVNTQLQSTKVQAASALPTSETGTSGTLFGLGGSTGNLGIGRLGEFIIINQQLTEAQHLGVVQFLMNRWGIV
jgi:hypothetical protein